MATRKPRKFAEGGMSDEDVQSFAGTSDNDSNAGMAEATEEPKAAPTPAPKAKPKIVTKEELAKSGLSLRDYMNKQQGLTRRGAPAPKAASKPEVKTLAPADKGETRKALPLKSTKAEKNAFMGSTGLKKGGSVKGWGQARGARKAKVY